MTRVSRGALALLLSVAAGACAAKTDDATARAAAEGVMAEYTRAKNAGDAAAITSLFTADAVWVVENAPPMSGREAIGAMFRPWFERDRVEFSATTAAAHGAGDRVIARGDWSLVSTPKAGGEGRPNGGGWMGSFRKDEGMWRYEWLMTASNRPARGRTADGADERALLQIEKDWAKALLAADTKALEAILAPDWVTSFEGSVMTRPQLFAALRSGAARFDALEASGEEPFVFGDSAIVRGLVRMKGIDGGKPFDGKSWYTDLFVRRDGRWQAVVGHNTPVE